MSLLGAVLANNRAIERVIDFLRPEHFADPECGRVYRSILAKIEVGYLADPVSLQNEFSPQLLAQLLSHMVGIINAGEYGRAIVDCWHRRQLIELGETIVNNAFASDPESDGLKQLEAAMKALSEIDVGNARGASRLFTSDQAMDAALEAYERARSSGGPAGFSTGFPTLDKRLGGLEPGLVYVIGGRPGSGKSALGHCIANNAAIQGKRVLELALEMSSTQLGRRSLASFAAVPLRSLKYGCATDEEASRLVLARRKRANLPLWIDDANGQTANQMRSKARAFKAKHGLDMLLVDHLNLTAADKDNAKFGLTQVIGHASNTMLTIAKECDIPVVVLVQLSRDVEKRDDHRPVLSDLRQAGDVEQDAYAVGFVFREEYYLGAEPAIRAGEAEASWKERVRAWGEEKQRLAGVAEIVWRKIRDGSPGVDKLRFTGETTSFDEIEKPDDAPGALPSWITE